MRGTYRGDWSIAEAERFIPACAGNIYPRVCDDTEKTVHPRVCGEHCSEDFSTLLKNGSSPRVRGTSFRHSYRCLIIRFIPACAGNILRKFLITGESTVHPRVCGEHDDPLASWGNNRRFIPACAGNIKPNISTNSIRAVHPRVCGEHGFHGDFST